VIADFQLGFSQAGEAATVEQFGVESASKWFGERIIVVVAAPVYTLYGPMAGQ